MAESHKHPREGQKHEQQRQQQQGSAAVGPPAQPVADSKGQPGIPALQQAPSTTCQHQGQGDHRLGQEAAEVLAAMVPLAEGTAAGAAVSRPCTEVADSRPQAPLQPQPQPQAVLQQAAGPPPSKRQRLGAPPAAAAPIPVPAARPPLLHAAGSAGLAAALGAAIASAASSPQDGAPAPSQHQHQQHQQHQRWWPREQPSSGRLERTRSLPVVDTLQQLAQVVPDGAGPEAQVQRCPYAMVSLELLQALHRAAQFAISEAKADLARQLLSAACAGQPASTHSRSTRATHTASASPPPRQPASGAPTLLPTPAPAPGLAVAAAAAPAAVPSPLVAPPMLPPAAHPSGDGQQVSQLLQQAAQLLRVAQAAGAPGQQQLAQPQPQPPPAAAAAAEQLLASHLGYTGLGLPAHPPAAAGHAAMRVEPGASCAPRQQAPCCPTPDVTVDPSALAALLAVLLQSHQQRSEPPQQH
ncbi:hypothetical protein ABPG75_001542 [Micractinium tetrahymenae]